MRNLSISASLLVALLATAPALKAHNNPTFREDLLLTLEVSAQPDDDGAHSRSFELALPDKTVQLIWRIEAAGGGDIKFDVVNASDPVLTNIADESKSKILKGKGFTVAGVTGASEPFKLKIFASVLDRSAGAKPAGDLAAGLDVYRKANCVGCHKWHGGGGGGYGGAALSLRKTGLTRELLIDVVRCGRPGTRMPYHERGAYKRSKCYGLSQDALGDKVPPKAVKLLRASQTEAVVDYVLAQIKGRDEPTLEECTAFWGENARQCDSMR